MGEVYIRDLGPKEGEKMQIARHPDMTILADGVRATETHHTGEDGKEYASVVVFKAGETYPQLQFPLEEKRSLTLTLGEKQYIVLH